MQIHDLVIVTAIDSASAFGNGKSKTMNTAAY